MNKKILIFSISATLLMLLMPAVSSLNSEIFMSDKEKIYSLKNYNVTKKGFLYNLIQKFINFIFKLISGLKIFDHWILCYLITPIITVILLFMGY